MKRYVLSIACLMMTLPVAAPAQNVTPAMKTSNDVAVIVNPNNTVTAVTSSELTSMLLGEKRFWNGKAPVQLILRQPGSHEFDLAVTKLLKMSPNDFKNSWKNKVFRGEAPAEPTYVPSSGMATQFSRDIPGALVLVAAHDLPADAKVLKIDGKLPGDQGYPLR